MHSEKRLKYEPPIEPGYLVLNRQHKRKIDISAVRRFLEELLPALGIDDRTFSVVFVTDKVMHGYNKTYRGFDKSTDVLSFCGEDDYLGDILISSETAHSQAIRSATLEFETNLQRLTLHGLLHLMGYDHETDNGEMRAIERRVRRRFRC